MKKVKVYLKGAYAPGNLGDDVLLVCMLNILKKHYRASEIFVGLDYPVLGKNIDPEIGWISSKEPVIAKVAVYGGGGQFFAFDTDKIRGASSSSIFNKIILSIKRQNGFLDALIRFVFGRIGDRNTVFKAERIAAFCVGVGPLDDSKKTPAIKRTLSSIDYFSVRDKTSAGLVQSLGLSVDGVFADPSLDSDLWWDKSLPLNVRSDDGYYSFVVRDWPYTNDGNNKIDLIVGAARHLKSKGCRVRIVSLFSNRDSHLRSKCEGLIWYEWDVSKESISSFLSNFISNSKVIVSSRAHGVWLPAVLGKSSIAIPIENKLVEVSNMLQGGVKLSSANNSLELVDEIRQFEASEDVFTEKLAAVNGVCKNQVREAVGSFDRWLSDVKNT